MASSHQSITLPVHACQVGSLSSANVQGNPRPSTNLEIIAGWPIGAVTTSGIKKLTCLQAGKPVKLQLLSAQICLTEPGPSFERPQACQCHQRPSWLAWGSKSVQERLGDKKADCPPVILYPLLLPGQNGQSFLSSELFIQSSTHHNYSFASSDQRTQVATLRCLGPWCVLQKNLLNGE